MRIKDLYRQCPHKTQSPDDRDFLFRQLAEAIHSPSWDAVEEWADEERLHVYSQLESKDIKECDLAFFMELKGQVSMLRKLRNLKSSVNLRNKLKENKNGRSS